MSEEYARPKWHTAELNGGTTRFGSYGKPGTYFLWSDAVQACKDAGLYRESSDAGRITVDGMPLK